MLEEMPAQEALRRIVAHHEPVNVSRVNDTAASYSQKSNNANQRRQPRTKTSFKMDQHLHLHVQKELAVMTHKPILTIPANPLFWGSNFVQFG